MKVINNIISKINNKKNICPFYDLYGDMAAVCTIDDHYCPENKNIIIKKYNKCNKYLCKSSK